MPGFDDDTKPGGEKAGVEEPADVISPGVSDSGAVVWATSVAVVTTTGSGADAAEDVAGRVMDPEVKAEEAIAARAAQKKARRWRRKR